MTVFLTAVTQIAILFILIAVGFFFSQKNVITSEVTKGMTRILFDVVTPCIIINSFQIEKTDDNLTELLIFSAAVIVYFIVAIAFAYLHMIGKGDAREKAVKRISTIYSNCGFMGLPLLTALSSIIGENGVFLGSVFITINNVFIFTQGVLIFSRVGNGEKPKLKDTLKKLLSPAVFGVLIGLILFLFSIKLPSVIATPIDYLGSMNTPLAMLLIGAMIEKSDWKHMFNDKRVYFTLACRNIILPLIILGIMAIFGLNSTVFLTCFIIISCPVAGNCVIFTDLYNGDRDLASKIFTLSTLSSSVTLPLLLTLASAVLKF